MMKVLVTGSSGLIGRWIGMRLDREGIEWVGVDVSPQIADLKCSQHYQVDILDAAALQEVFEQSSPTHVIHLAARCDLDGKTVEDYEANRGGVLNLCDAIRKTSSVSRAIFTSSQLVCEVGYVPKDDVDYCPHTVYGESKVFTEQVVREQQGGDVTWCLARPTTVWGPHMSDHYKSLWQHIENGRFFHSGSGALYKSYSYAENIAHQYFRLLMAPEDQVSENTFYMADYEPLSLRDYANSIASSLGVKSPVTIPFFLAKLIALGGDLLNGVGVKFPFNSFRLKNIRTEYIFDLSKTEAVCGALPKSFEQGIQETAKWYRS
jgi:nucleoside-diphosphate-sugar epimerase